MGFSPNFWKTLPRFSRFARLSATPRRAASTFRAVTVSSDALLSPPPFAALPVKSLASLVPAKGEVILSVKAAAVNFPDLLICQGKYQFKPEGDFSPGSEVAGIVKEVGEGVKGFTVGDRVLGSSAWGGFAEEMRMPYKRIIPMPPTMPFDEASALLMAYGTSHYALYDRGSLKEGETLVVLGASGGVGLAAVQLGKAKGARVIACASSAEKLALCKEHGADVCINYAEENLKDALKREALDGVDVCYDPVGGDYSEAVIRSMAWGGRFLVIGFAAGSIPKVALNLCLLKGCSIVGVFWGAMTIKEPKHNVVLLTELMELYTAGKVKPVISATYPLEKAGEAMNAMAERKVTGKVVLVP
mmetsp:Transcript_48520/g.114465  ORF Transcript_48520/g.114465 Transcript_48520/m.114465 type:complete len:359 (+) Transcript_48520:49-1125(+)